MRSDRMLGYEFGEDSSSSQMTGHAGLLPYLDLSCVLGVLSEADARVGVCGKQGWMDRHHVLSLVLLNLAGGECVEDIRMLESDAGLCRVFGEAEVYGLGRGARKEMEKRFRKGRERARLSTGHFLPWRKRQGWMRLFLIRQILRLCRR